VRLKRCKEIEDDISNCQNIRRNLQCNRDNRRHKGDFFPSCTIWRKMKQKYTPQEKKIIKKAIIIVAYYFALLSNLGDNLQDPIIRDNLCNTDYHCRFSGHRWDGSGETVLGCRAK